MDKKISKILKKEEQRQKNNIELTQLYFFKNWFLILSPSLFKVTIFTLTLLPLIFKFKLAFVLFILLLALLIKQPKLIFFLWVLFF